MPCLHDMERSDGLARKYYLGGTATGTTADDVGDIAGTSRVVLGGSSAEVGHGDSSLNSSAGGLGDGESLHIGREGGPSIHDAVVDVGRCPTSDTDVSVDGRKVEEEVRLPLDSSKNNTIGRLPSEEDSSNIAGSPPDTTVAPAWCADDCTSSLEELVCWTKGLDYDAAVKGF